MSKYLSVTLDLFCRWNVVVRTLIIPSSSPGWIDGCVYIEAQRPDRRRQRRATTHHECDCNKYGNGIAFFVWDELMRRFSVLITEMFVFILQAIGLLSQGIDNWGHVSLGDHAFETYLFRILFFLGIFLPIHVIKCFLFFCLCLVLYL